MNLAILNAVPFPTLDGGRFFLMILEKIRRKKLNVNVERWIHFTGFALLMLLILLVTVKDIMTYGSGVWQSFIGLFS